MIMFWKEIIISLHFFGLSCIPLTEAKLEFQLSAEDVYRENL